MPNTSTPPDASPWASLGRLLADPAVGPASKLAYAWLWDQAGGRPDHIVTTTRHLGHALGRSARSAAGWLAELERHGLIQIADRDRRGVIHLYIYSPHPGGGETTAPPDPQRRLPLQTPPPPPPPPRGDLYAETPAAGITAQEPPGVSAQKPPSRSPETPQNTPPEPIAAGVSAQKPPRRPHGTIERDLKISHTHRKDHPWNMEHGGAPATAAAGDDLAELGHVSTALVEALTERIDPAETRRAKAELVAYLTAAVNDPNTDASIFRQSADLVIEHGLASAVLERIAETCRRKGRAGLLKSPGAYFYHLVRKAASEAGIPWVRSKRATKETKP